MANKLYIKGEWRNASDGAESEVRNPATGEVLARVAYGGIADALAAMDAAAAAFPDWSARTAQKRAALLVRAAEQIRKRADEIARVVTEENGKPLKESLAETTGCAAWLEWFAEEAKRNYGRLVPSHTGEKRLWVIQQPLGVVVAVTPWNFPINLMARKLGAALAAGCTVVCRPADQTPLSAMRMFECLDEAGFPPGSVALVTGDPAPVVQAMMNHPACRKLAFTGSTEVGKKLMQQASRRLIKVSLELGGHAPLLVFPDVDIAKAAELTVMGKFRNAGQSCIAPSRIYVQRGIFEAFRAAVVARTRKIVVGNGLSEEVEMGPMLGKPQFERAEAFVADAVAKGAGVLAGGQRLTGGEFDKGYFYAPTVLDNIHSSMRLTCEEIFGPILPLIPFESEKEVIAAANNTTYGLAAYVLVRDLSVALRVVEALEYGIVGLNDTVPTVPVAPFGGWKESGIGREGGYEGMQAYLETKFISVGIEPAEG